MFKFLKNLFSDPSLQNNAPPPQTSKPNCKPCGQGIKNCYPDLLDGKSFEIVLKEKKKFKRDSKGRFAKKDS